MNKAQTVNGARAPAAHAWSRLKLTGSFDEDALRGALDDVLGGLAANAGVELPQFELTVTELGFATPQERRAEVDALIEWDTHLPFDAARGLLRARVIHLNDDAQVFLLTADRSICATWPVRRMLAAVGARYMALRRSSGWGAPLSRHPLNSRKRAPRGQTGTGIGRASSRRENSSIPATLIISPSSTPSGAPITPNLSRPQ